MSAYDPNYVYGDSTHPLSDHAVAGAQNLIGRLLVGDAPELLGHAQGGADTLTSANANGGDVSILVGDAFSITGHARGGADVLTISASFGKASGYGDAFDMSGYARGGNDTITGHGDSHTANYEFGDAGSMSGHAVGGNDVLLSNTGHVFQYGDAQTLSDFVQAGNDTITGATFFPGLDTHMYGDGETISGHVRCGNDLLIDGSPGNGETLYGDGKTICGAVHCGNDTLTAAAPAFSSAFATTMYGDGETLGGYAQGGNDVLISGTGNEVMWGDAANVGPHARTGADLFVFTPPNGHDQIMDFQPGKDRIELKGFGYSFADLYAHHMQTVAQGTLISFDANDDILLKGLAKSQLHAGDFLLVA